VRGVVKNERSKKGDDTVGSKVGRPGEEPMLPKDAKKGGAQKTSRKLGRFAEGSGLKRVHAEAAKEAVGAIVVRGKAAAVCTIAERGHVIGGNIRRSKRHSPVITSQKKKWCVRFYMIVTEEP